MCRERSISQDGERLISREVIVHDEMGVIADQFYAERLYTRESIAKLMEKTGFRNVRHHGHAEALSDRDQDLGMMARRILLTADAPQLPVRKGSGKLQALDVTVLMGDPRLPDQVKRGGTFNPEDLETVRKLKDALSKLPGYKFRYLDNHGTLERDLSELSTDLVFNLCDEGWNNDPFKELHVPALLEVLGIGYTGAGPSALAACYDKGLVRAVAQALDVPVPLESYVRPGDQGATLPSVFPALLKPNHGDSSQGITKDSVVTNEKAPARLPRPAARRVPQARRAGAGVPDRGGVLGAAGRQSGPGPARLADPGGRLLQARRQTCRRSSATNRSGSRTAPTGRRSSIARRRWPIRSSSSSSTTRRACSSAWDAATTPASTSAPTPRARSSCWRSTPTRAGAGTAR